MLTFDIIILLIVALVAILLLAVISAQIGNALARTFLLEKIFEEFRESKRFKRFFHVYLVKRNIQRKQTYVIESVFGYLDRKDKFIEIDNLPIDNRRLDIKNKFLSFVLMKIGDMLSCVFCLSAQISYWLMFITSVSFTLVTLSPVSWLVASGAIAVCAVASGLAIWYSYALNDFLNRHVTTEDYVHTMLEDTDQTLEDEEIYLEE